MISPDEHETMTNVAHPIVIVGAGGAGLIAAWRAASMGAPVILFEKNTKVGIKLLISGGGKCNVTHDGAMEELRREFSHHESRFLKHAFFSFTNADVRRMLEARGVATLARPNGRVFPSTGRAADVVEALLSLLWECSVKVRLGSRVESILIDGNGVRGIVVQGKTLLAQHVVLATGGASYRKTGTTGDGFLWATAMGHSVVPLRPALAPIGLRPPLPDAWRGIALRDGCLYAYSAGKRVDSCRGDLLFTHEGISGPAPLAVSRAAAQAMEVGDVSLRFDFFPGLDPSALDQALNQLIRSNGRKQLGTILEALVPNRMIEWLLTSVHVSVQTRGHVLLRADRAAVVRLLKSWEMGSVERIDLDRGEVTAGGVALSEVDPHTMASRIVPGLYLAGEVLDIAGPIGGYNLQAAFSTGFVAGESAAREWLDSHESGLLIARECLRQV